MTGRDMGGGPVPLLEVSGLSKDFGGIQAVADCALTVDQGSITGLIGPNGSGKTTFFNLLTGNVSVDRGQILLGGEDIAGLTSYRIASKGIGRTFQLTRVFKKMTVLENLRVSALHEKGSNSAEHRIEELLELFDLVGYEEEYAEDLSYGQQKLLEFARVLVPGPRLVLLDEPFAGVNRVMAGTVADLIRRFRDEGTTFFLIDHEMKVVMELCDWLYVLNFGQIIATGTPADVRNDPDVMEAYFGR